jgi:hypothetical protein
MGFCEFIDRFDSLLPSRALRATQRWSLALWIASAWLLAASGASAVVIDTFAVGPFSVTDYGGAVSGTGGLQTGLSPDEVMGGTRKEWITMEYPLESESATAQLGGGGYVALSVTNMYARGWYEFDWDLSEPVDLTHGGVANSFRVEFLQLPNHRWGGLVTATVEIWVNSPGNRLGRVTGVYVNAPGVLEVPFSALSAPSGIDLTQVTRVRLLVYFQNALSGQAVISDFRTGPEPPPTPACDDGLDNDGDGFTDHPDDPGCADAADDSEKDETGTYPCDDGVDNDADTLVDCPDDPGCTHPAAWIEDPTCQDGEDNDGDGKIDFDGGLSALGYLAADPDPQCNQAWLDSENPCGLGAELALLMPPLMWLSRRRRWSRAGGRCPGGRTGSARRQQFSGLEASLASPVRFFPQRRPRGVGLGDGEHEECES